MTSRDVALLYDQALATGALQPDAAQRQGITVLNDLFHALTARRAPGFWSRLFKRTAPASTRGVYLYGPVGRGKSMLMQFFIDALQGWNAHRPPGGQRRVERQHFHAFMLDLHHQLFLLKRSGGGTDGEPLDLLADRLAARLDILCFDEFHATEITDAMLLMPFFTALLDRGVCVVATSNFAPADLYQNGLQRGRFLPFIDLLQRRLQTVCIGGPQDFRLQRWRDIGQQRQDRWLTPVDAASAASFKTLFADLAGYDTVQDNAEIAVPDQQRSVRAYKTASRVAWLCMDDLLADAVGAADFLALAAAFQIMLLDGVTPFAANENDRAKRFMLLIDTLYEAGTQIYVRAAAPPDALYPAGGRLSFEFARTVSRLQEMRFSKS